LCFGYCLLAAFALSLPRCFFLATLYFTPLLFSIERECGSQRRFVVDLTPNRLFSHCSSLGYFMIRLTGR
jgi:hypothetical protein